MRKSIHFWTQKICIFCNVFPMNTSKLHQKSMKYDGETIYKHEIDMPMRFLMVLGSENHYFDEFLTFYFKKLKKSKIKKIIQHSTPCSKSLKKHISDAQN